MKVTARAQLANNRFAAAFIKGSPFEKGLRQERSCKLAAARSETLVRARNRSFTLQTTWRIEIPIPLAAATTPHAEADTTADPLEMQLLFYK